MVSWSRVIKGINTLQFLKKYILYVFAFFLLFAGCKTNNKSQEENTDKKNLPDQFIVVLGTAQDAGYPQIGCTKECCTAYWDGKEAKKHITNLALVDRKTNQYWLFEATPDITSQLNELQGYLTKKKLSCYVHSSFFTNNGHFDLTRKNHLCLNFLCNFKG